MISVYIVDDHQIVIEGLISLLQDENDIKVVGYANAEKECLDFLNGHYTDVILLDINLHDSSGIDLCCAIKNIYAKTKILALSTFDQGSYILKMIEAGANGYLLKNTSKKELVEGIKSVHDGNIYFSFESGRIYKTALEKRNEKPLLTKREKEIAKLIAEGNTNNQIAQLLFISADTVDSHRKNIYFKLDVNNVAALIKALHENGVL